MLLIFEQQRSLFGEELRRAAEKRGLSSWWLSAQEIVDELWIAFYLDTAETRVTLSYKSGTIEKSGIAGVYTTVDYFPSESFGFLSLQDREYAAREWHALWLSLLNSLSCIVVNPPAADALGGSAPGIAELFMQARRCGIMTPAVAEVESGTVAAELAGSNPVLSAVDLGEGLMRETPLNGAALRSHPLSEHHIRIREYLSLPVRRVTIIGTTCYLTADCAETRTPALGESLKARLLDLHRKLNLKIAEYQLYDTGNDGWLLFSLIRSPSAEAMQAHGEKLVDGTLDLIMEG